MRGCRGVRRLGLLVLLVLPAVALAASSYGAVSAGTVGSAPTIASDKPDYSPGELVTLSGSNWAPGESVHIFVNDDAGQTWSRNVDVTANEMGRISDQFNLPDWFVATYSVTATGARSGTATTSFTDASLVVRRGPTGDPPNLSFTVQYRSFSDNACSQNPNPPTTQNPSSAVVNTDVGTSLGGLGGGQGGSVKLTAPATPTSPAGYAFKQWTAEGDNTTMTASDAGRSICVRNPAGSQSDIYRATYEVANTAPAATAPSFSPTPPKTNDILTASTTTSDAEGDNVSVSWVWKVTRGANTCQVATDGSAAAAPGTRSVSLDLSQSYATSNCTGASPPSSINPSKGDTVTVEATPNDGKLSGTMKSNSVAVVNSAPTVSITAGPTSADEGAAATYTFTAADADADPLNFVVGYPTCGSGQLQGTPTVAGGTFDCVFPDGPANTTVAVKVSDGTASSSEATRSVTVKNVAPSVVLSGDFSDVDEGTTRTYTYTVTDPGADSPSVTESCGGGAAYISDATANSFKCKFLDGPGSSTVNATADDGDASNNIGDDPHTVTIKNVAPPAPSLIAPADGNNTNDNTPTFDWSDVTDPGDDTVSYAIQADNSGCSFASPEINASGLGSSAFTPASPLADGTYCWRVSATDSDNADSAYSAARALTVDTAKPNATITFPAAGGTYTAATWDSACGTPAGDACGTASDTGTGVANVEFSLQRASDGTYWNGSAWVTSATRVFVAASGTTSWTYAFSSVDFPADGSYTARARSNDRAGNVSELAEATFTVNVPPKVSAGGPLYSGNEGSAIQLNGTVSSDAQTKSWSYTKGADVDAGATCAFGNAASPSTTFTCTDDGTYTVRLTASDGTNPASTSEAVVKVENVVPSVKITSPASAVTIFAGASVTVSASFTDAGANDKHTCRINRGDGTSVVGTVTESGGNGKCTGSVKYTAKGTYLMTVTVTDDDGGEGTSPPVTVNVK